ncbi:protein-export chaperone SecB [uncultured Cedecea sp.]|uniref:protein-export chaperone SecB n=1 Tax=uncultured Cedecea sp. TaxID=988762 RepID=UPI002625BC5E|nr:protein-export chaperone SecB [uncultured Cedecea sp.]
MITLQNRQVQNLSLEKNHKEKNKDNKVKTNISSQLFTNVKDNSLFRVRYVVKITANGYVDVDLSYDFDFKTTDIVDEEFTKSLVVRSEAPSLAYPYIKTYIESVCQLSGYGTLNLPYADFTKEPLDMK